MAQIENTGGGDRPNLLFFDIQDDQIGPLRANDVEVVVSPALGDVNVIGMNMLSRLRSWSVENGEMVLTP